MTKPQYQFLLANVWLAAFMSSVAKVDTQMFCLVVAALFVVFSVISSNIKDTK